VAKEAQATAAAAEWKSARLELEAANARLAAELEAKSLEISKHALEKTGLVKEHVLQMQELQAAMEAKDQKLGALRLEIGEQEERHRRLMCEKDGALAAKDRELGEACCEAGEKGRALAKALADGSEAKSVLQHLQHQLQHLKQQLQRLQQQLQEEVSEAKTCWEVTQRSLMELQTKHTLLTFELDASRGNAKESTAGLHALHERMAMMEEHNNSILKSLGEAETRLSGSKNANMENEIYIKDLQRSLMELETKHTLLTFERDTLRGDATELTAEVDNLRHVAACLTHKLAVSEKQLSDEQERLLTYADIC
jgi:chromosome segregation ATPase